MLQFKATYTRYSNKTCRREVSAPEFVHANSWHEATRHMAVMVVGMNAAAEDGMSYQEASLEQVGLSGHVHNMGLWTSLPEEDGDPLD